MRYLVSLMLQLALLAVAGCALPEWKPPKEPYVDLHGSSDDYTQGKWSR